MPIILKNEGLKKKLRPGINKSWTSGVIWDFGEQLSVQFFRLHSSRSSLTRLIHTTMNVETRYSAEWNAKPGNWELTETETLRNTTLNEYQLEPKTLNYTSTQRVAKPNCAEGACYSLKGKKASQWGALDSTRTDFIFLFALFFSRKISLSGERTKSVC